MKVVLLMFILFSLCGCLSGTGKKSRTNIKISSTFAASVPTGGMMLYLSNKDTQTQRAIKLTDTVTTIELYAGNWEFVAISWSGAGPFLGSLSCGKTTALLQNATETVNLTISNTRCDDDYFAPAAFRTSGFIKPFRFVNCANISSASPGSNCDSTLRGYIGGYKIKLLSHGEVPLSNLSEVQYTSTNFLGTGSCNVPVSSPNSVEPLAITVPYGGVNGFRPSFVIETYSDSVCATPLKNFFYPSGFAGPEVTMNNSSIFTTAAHGELYLETGSVSIAGSTVFGTGVLGTSSTQTLTVSNFMGVNLSSLSASITGSGFTFVGGAYPGTGGTCTNTLNNGSTCTMAIVFNRPSLGSFSETLTLSYNDGAAKTLAQTLTGVSVTPAYLNLSTSSHNFNDTLAHHHKSLTITVQNTGGAAATTVAFSLTGTDAAKFSIPSGSNTCGTTINSLATCSFRVDFLPDADRNFSATAAISYNDGSMTQTPTVSLTGKGNHFPATNGTGIYAFEKHNNLMFVGGDFTLIGKPTGAGVPVKKTSCSGEGCVAIHSSLSAMPKIAGTVNVVISDGYGGFYVGGNFSRVGSSTQKHLVRIGSNGLVDSTFAVTLDGEVFALALSGGSLYIGGSFANVNSTSRASLAKVNSSTGNLDGTFTPAPNGSVRNIQAGPNIYVGGNFTTIGGQSRTKIAILDSSTGSATAMNPGSLFLGLTDIRALYYSSNVLYIGGAFSNFDNVTPQRPNLAALDLTTGNALSGFTGSANSTVFSIKPMGASKLILTGAFGTVSGSTRVRIAVIDRTNGSVDPFTLSHTGVAIYDTFYDSVANLIHIGGDFSVIGGQNRRNYAVVTYATTPVVQNISPDFVGPVTALTEGANGMFVGGSFRGIEAVPRTNLAAVDLTTGITTTSTYNASGGTVFDLAKDSTNLYVAGDFTTFKTTSCTGLIGMNLSTEAVSWAPCANGRVRSVEVANNNIYVGGLFSTINNGASRIRFATFSSPNFSLTGFAPTFDAEVLSIKFAASQLFIGGIFSTRFEVYSSSHTSVTAPAVNGVVHTLESDGTTLFMGGEFGTVGGLTKTRIATLNASTLADSSLISQSVTGSRVSTIALFDNMIYAGGFFTLPKNNIMFFDTSGVLQSPNLAPNSAIRVMRSFNDILMIGGDFTEFNGIAGSNIRIKSLPPL